MEISASDIAQEFDLTLKGNSNAQVTDFGSLYKKGETCIQWAKNETYLAAIDQGTVVCNNKDYAQITARPEVCYLCTDKSQRLVFAKILTQYFSADPDLLFVNCVEDHRKNPTLRIAENVFIGANVSIGDGTIIHPNVVIYSNTKIGANCIIKTHVSIGTEGLGLEMDKETNTYFSFPQIGGVVMHDNVVIGPTSTIRRSALDDTIVGAGTQIGSMVNIGHNCIIGENCILTCNIVTSGSSKIGNNVFVGVGSMLRQGVKVGNDVTLGQGAVVTKNVPDTETWIGCPAQPIADYKAESNFIKAMISEAKDQTT